LQTLKKDFHLPAQVFRTFEVIFDVDAKRKEIDRLSGLMSLPDFWNDEQNATAVVKKLKTLKSIV
jgi:hypothetical protein